MPEPGAQVRLLLAAAEDGEARLNKLLRQKAREKAKAGKEKVPGHAPRSSPFTVRHAQFDGQPSA